MSILRSRCSPWRLAELQLLHVYVQFYALCGKVQSVNAECMAWANCKAERSMGLLPSHEKYVVNEVNCHKLMVDHFKMM